MLTQKIINELITTPPRTGFVVLAVNYGYGNYFFEAFIGYHEEPQKAANGFYPDAKSVSFFTVPLKYRTGFSFGIGTPQSKRDH